MCSSQFAQYTERPIKEYKTVRPTGAPLTEVEKDPNLFGSIPVPPAWRVEVEQEDSNDYDHDHSHASANGNGHQRAAEAVETPATTVYTAPSPVNDAMEIIETGKKPTALFTIRMILAMQYPSLDDVFRYSES